MPSADLAFTQFVFPATGAPTPRTMPDRLAEEKNVLEYGADPTGVADSTAAIQAAKDAAVAGGTGVFLPVGIYKVSDSGSGSAVLLNEDRDFGFYMKGAAGGGSVITSSNCPGYLIDRSLGTPNNTIGPRVFENISFINTTASPTLGGGLRMGSSIGVIVRNCRFSAAGACLTTEDEPGASSQNILVDTCVFGSSTLDLASIGLVMGGSGLVTCCDASGEGTGFIVYGKGISLDSNRCESSNYGLVLGVDSSDIERELSGFSCICLEMEATVNNVDFRGKVTGFYLGVVGALGHAGFTSPVSPESTQYGVRIRANKAYFGTFDMTNTGQTCDVAGVYMEDYAAPKRSFVTFSNCIQTVAGAGVPWRIPASSAWPSFSDCYAIDSSLDPPSGTRYLYSGLPTGGDVLEGDEFDISNGNSGTIGGTVTAGGGANRVRVRWNGTNWICLPG